MKEVVIDGVRYVPEVDPLGKPDRTYYGVAVCYESWMEVHSLGPENTLGANNLRLTFDSKTGKLKSAEVL